MGYEDFVVLPHSALIRFRFPGSSVGRDCYYQCAQWHGQHQIFRGHLRHEWLRSLRVEYRWSASASITKKVSSSTTSLDLSGTPTRAGTDSFTVEVKGCGGLVSTRSYKIVIQSTANHVVDLQWKPSTSRDITGYNVYRSPDGVTWKKSNVSLIGSTLFSDSTVANGSTYYYAATTVDINGHESSKSSSVKVTVP